MALVRTSLLLAALTGLFMAVGAIVGGQQGMLVAFGIALAMNLFTYWNADRMVLAMYRARPVDEAAAPQLYATIRELTQRAGLPMPRVYIIDTVLDPAQGPEPITPTGTSSTTTTTTTTTTEAPPPAPAG